MMKLSFQVSTLQTFDQISLKKNNPFRQNLTLMNKTNFDNFRQTNDEFGFHNSDYLGSNFIKKRSFP